jgi:hypothetical protein
MPKSETLERTIVDHVKFGALAVLNKALSDTIQTGDRFELWPAEDQRVYHLIIDVQQEILRRVEATFAKRKRRPALPGGNSFQARSKA